MGTPRPNNSPSDPVRSNRWVHLHRTSRNRSLVFELVGPQGAGKSTLAPRLARRLGLSFFAGQGFHNLHGAPFIGVEAWKQRSYSIIRNPRLCAQAVLMKADVDTRRRFDFALNLCRRNLVAHQIRKTRGGVVDSGPAHGLCQFASSTAIDVVRLARLTIPADAYIRLHADPSTLIRRLALRDSSVSRKHDPYLDSLERYQAALSLVLEAHHQPVINIPVDDGDPLDLALSEIHRLAEHSSPDSKFTAFRLR